MPPPTVPLKLGRPSGQTPGKAESRADDTNSAPMWQVRRGTGATSCVCHTAHTPAHSSATRPAPPSPHRASCELASLGENFSEKIHC